MVRTAAGIFLAVFSQVAVSLTPAGTLDRTFGAFNGDADSQDGIVVGEIDQIPSGGDESRAIAETLDGALLLAGIVETEGTPCLGLARFTRDGVADPAFHDQTSYKTCHQDPLGDLVDGTYTLNADLDMVAAPNGDIYVAGTVFVTQGPRSKTFVCRFLSNGVKQACVSLDIPGDLNLAMTEPNVLLQGQQLLVVATPPGGLLTPVLFRLSAEDLSVETQHQILGGNFGGTNFLARDADLTANGDLLIAGNARFESGDIDNFVARYALGANLPDATFDTDGFKRITYNAIANGRDTAGGVRALPNGDILAVGRVALGGTAAAVGISWLDASGDAVESFNNGLPLIMFGDTSANIEPWVVDLTPSGRIVVAGMYKYPDEPSRPLALRLLSNGSADADFGTEGVGVIPLSAFDGDTVAYGMVLQDERIVLGGTTDWGLGDLNFFLLRFSDGTLFSDGFELVP